MNYQNCLNDIYGVVIWDQRGIGPIISYKGGCLFAEDGFRYIGDIYCTDCIPDGAMSKYVYAQIKSDYGFKLVAHCCKCKKAICKEYDKKRKLYVPVYMNSLCQTDGDDVE